MKQPDKAQLAEDILAKLKDQPVRENEDLLQALEALQQSIWQEARQGLDRTLEEKQLQLQAVEEREQQQEESLQRACADAITSTAMKEWWLAIATCALSRLPFHLDYNDRHERLHGLREFLQNNSEVRLSSAARAAQRTLLWLQPAWLTGRMSSSLVLWQTSVLCIWQCSTLVRASVRWAARAPGRLWSHSMARARAVADVAAKASWKFLAFAFISAAGPIWWTLEGLWDLVVPILLVLLYFALHTVLKCTLVLGAFLMLCWLAWFAFAFPEILLCAVYGLVLLAGVAAQQGS